MGEKLKELIAKRLEGLIQKGGSQKEDLGTTKYLIHARIEANGVVERPDVVGAIFGQTEGLLGDELDLRELQKTSRIGRIKVEISSSEGKSTGKIIIPSSLDKVETSLIAAALETIDRVGPCEAVIKVERIEDVREEKRKFIVSRAKQILEQMNQVAPETQELSELVKDFLKLEELVSYKGLPAGPGVTESDAIIIVEGRADVINLLRCGIRNVIALEGTSVPKQVVELSKNKTTTVFLDGDRGGDLILKELLQVADVDFVARAPPGKGVQDLTKKEVIKALRNKVPVDQVLAEVERRPQPKGSEEQELRKLKEAAVGLQGSLKARLLGESLEKIKELEVRELKQRLPGCRGVKAVIFDGIITRELAEVASRAGIKYLVGAKRRLEHPPAGLKVLTTDELYKMGRNKR